MGTTGSKEHALDIFHHTTSESISQQPQQNSTTTKTRHSTNIEVPNTLTKPVPILEQFHDFAPSTYNVDDKPPKTELVPTIFRWPYGGKSVFLHVAFDGGSEKVPMSYNSEEEEFIAIVNVPVGKCMYRYVVDGQNKLDPQQPAMKDSRSNLSHNVIEIQSFDEDELSSDSMDSGSGSLSPSPSSESSRKNSSAPHFPAAAGSVPISVPKSISSSTSSRTSSSAAMNASPVFFPTRPASYDPSTLSSSPKFNISTSFNTKKENHLSASLDYSQSMPSKAREPISQELQRQYQEKTFQQQKAQYEQAYSMFMQPLNNHQFLEKHFTPEEIDFNIEDKRLIKGEEYTQEDLMFVETKKDPPVVPPQFKFSVLNAQPKQFPYNPELLPVPLHVTVNHTYFFDREPGLTVAVTNRYKDKFSTIVAYKPAPKANKTEQ